MVEHILTLLGININYADHDLKLLSQVLIDGSKVYWILAKDISFGIVVGYCLSKF